MAIIPKRVEFGSEARSYILKGAEIMARAVGTTLGPKSGNVLLHSKYGGVKIVHDGVTTSNEVKLDDPREDGGATALREAARKTNDSSGDGTTTATVLAYEILREGNSHIIAGVNSMIMKKGIDTATKQAVELLKEMAEPIKESLEKMIQVATVSAADEEIGKVIAKALKKVGKYGVVTVDKGVELGYHTEYKDGMEWDKGWNLPYFVTDPTRGEAILKDLYILVTDRTITGRHEILPVLELIAGQDNKNLLIVSDGMEGEAQKTLLENHVNIIRPNGQRGTIQSLAVGAPSLGEHKRDGLEDIAIITGATFFSKELGRSFKEITLKDLGRADQVVSTQDSTIIVGGKGDVEKVKTRVEQIKGQLEEATHELLKEKFIERLAKLTSGVAVVKVGTSSDAENTEKTERVKDAIGATKAAVEEGIVPGGGVALLQVAQKINTDLPLKEESIGAEILKRALLKPIKLLVENAGDSSDVVINETLKREPGIGYNVVTGEYVDMKIAGIVDPVKVTISAVQNAASVAGLLLTVEATVTDMPDPEREKKEQEK